MSRKSRWKVKMGVWSLDTCRNATHVQHRGNGSRLAWYTAAVHCRCSRTISHAVQLAEIISYPINCTTRQWPRYVSRSLLLGCHQSLNCQKITERVGKFKVHFPSCITEKLRYLCFSHNNKSLIIFWNTAVLFSWVFSWMHTVYNVRAVEGVGIDPLG